ncbi:MAG: hypothetical protein BWY99_02029 [Synergistetes bacterium ADurb.BinA166]|nr:MAG: hypothetical protein BWY99_02029 [Synergistetes bacterium ADurb.BinA166]
MSPLAQALPHRWFPGQAVKGQVEQRAAAQVLDEDHSSLLGQRGQILAGDGADEPLHPEVGRVDLEDCGRPVGYRPLVIPQVGPVGSAGLDQARTGELHDLRYAEGAAYLDELPTGDNHLPASTQRREGQEHGAGVVVHHQPRLRAGNAPDEPLHVICPAAPSSLGEVELEGAVSPRHRAHRLHSPVRQAGAAQVGVDDHPGGVDHRDQAVRRATLQLGQCPGQDRVEGGLLHSSFEQVRPGARECRGEDGLHRLPPYKREEGRRPLRTEEQVHRRQRAQPGACGFILHLVGPITFHSR